MVKHEAIKSTYGEVATKTFAALLAITFLSVIFTNATPASADESAKASVNVVTSCTLSSTVDDDHAVEASLGNWNDGIGQTTMTVKCNDPNGYAVYAVGYSNDEWKNTDLIHTDPSDGASFSSYNIATSSYDETSTNSSYWSMKLYTDELVSPATISAPYNNYSAVPGDYTKVASLDSTTSGNSVSSFKLTYGAYVVKDQAMGNYTGKVKYTLVNPHSATDANKPDAKDPAYYMQDIATLKDTKLANIGDTLTVVDKRDDSEYLVAKLADDKIWMLDNLAFNGKDNQGSGDYITMDSTDTNLTSGRTLTWSDTVRTSWSNTYTEAKINDASKETPVTSYGSGSGKVGVYYNYCATSAGTICTSSNSSNASQDICPAGWRLPTSSEFQTVYGKYNTTQTATDANSLQHNLSLPLSGRFYSSQAYDQGSDGYWWSSTLYDGSFMYRLYVNASSVNPAGYGDRFYGQSVRCVAQ